MEFSDFIFWSFSSLLTGIICFSAYAVREDFKSISRSLQTLSVAVARLTGRLESLERNLERLDKRIERVENFKGE